ncbi:FAD-dependent oxidoreductase [Alkalibacter mobilis]|uniref:FAD-dependent oxidoreductase n=1 Tax=Alkalibacter mobilis TaxID=2787712 RepID=UPI00189E443C|nr:FAD-dependent oxidoreductase [Alkalibacter mobilis]MBF7097416.1 FAD-dependent oxidoreductase [Alkalibacter mobilis]
MTKLNIEEKRISTDVVIVGGGIAGLTAAVRIKELNSDIDILIIEKNTTGYSGKANRGGGVLQYFDFNRCTPEQFVGYHAHNVGAFLGDQELLYKYVSMNNEMIEKLVNWGVKVPYDEDGNLKVIPTGPMTGMIGVDLDITLQVRKTAAKFGVKIVDKTVMSDILTNNGEAVGVVGYDLIDGTFSIIKAKSVILATGSQNYKIMPMWNGRGDGIAAAYRAGAEMRNAEFGNFAQQYKAKSHHDMVFSENVMYNSLGENITKNFRRFPEADVSSKAVSEWYKQMSAGKGPVYIHPDEYEVTAHGDALFTTPYVWNRPYGIKIWKKIYGKAAEKDGDCKEVVMCFVGEQSPVKVGHDMQTTIPGLYAVGDISYSGSASPGAVPAPPGRNRGSGILNAVFNGLIAAESSLDRVSKKDESAIDDDQVMLLKERTYAPLLKSDGIDAEEIMEDIREAVGPVENSVYMSQHRIDIGLRKVEKTKNKLENLKAQDYHDLCNCHEAQAMVLSAEMQFRAASMRKESRGWFLREDYPETDNRNWLKYIIVKNNEGKMDFSTENVPIEKYPVKPLFK